MKLTSVHPPILCSNNVNESRTMIEILDAYEKQVILDSLHCTENVTQAAKLLSISKQRLRYKIEKHEIRWREEMKVVKEDVPESLQEGGLSLVEKLEQMEFRLIAEALNACPTAKAAADQLGISKQSLNYKLKKYKIKK